jgi:DNA-binding winged helix-turn-helix (wHTH) protein
VDPGHPWGEHPGADGTLLAIVPIPGTQTSLAIVGYAISAAAGPNPPHGQPAARGVPAPADPGAQPAPTAPGPDPDGLLIDRVQRRVWADGGEIPLTFQEFELLAFLSAHPAEVFSRADLLRLVWQPPEEPGPAVSREPRRPPSARLGTRTVDVHVSRLRRKLGPGYGQCLVTEHRAGYQFRPLPAEAGVHAGPADDNVINTSCRAE